MLFIYIVLSQNQIYRTRLYVIFMNLMKRNVFERSFLMPPSHDVCLPTYANLR